MEYRVKNYEGTKRRMVPVIRIVKKVPQSPTHTGPGFP